MFREKRAWQSTSNGVGKSLGMFVGNVLFIVLESRNFSNNYIRKWFDWEQQPRYGIVSLGGFMLSFGTVCVFSTGLVAVFLMKEEQEPPEARCKVRAIIAVYAISCDVARRTSHAAENAQVNCDQR